MWPHAFMIPLVDREHTPSTGLGSGPGERRCARGGSITVLPSGVTMGAQRVTMIARDVPTRHGAGVNIHAH